MNDLNEIKSLKPFTRFLMTIGEIPTSYLISMTYEEQLLWLCNYLEKTVIPAINNNAESVKELQNLYTQLKNYVDSYFDNLDIQEEINNKLDEMSESGELEEIIAQYLQLKSILIYENVNEMKNSEKIINGNFIQTLGYYEKGDGGSSKYLVREIVNTDVIDEKLIIALNNPNLVAVYFPEKEVNVKQLGAYGDSTNDDSDTIQKAINYCIQNNKPLFIDESRYLINTTLEINAFIKFTCLGVLVLNSDITLLKLNGDRLQIDITSMLSNNNGTAVEIIKSNYSEIKIRNIYDFKNGIKIVPNNAGCQYNRITFNLIRCDEKNIFIKASNRAWVNQNVIDGGQLVTGYGIYFDGSDTTADYYNGNIFLNCGFEQSNRECIHLERCLYNEFNHFRIYETLSSNILISIDANSFSNKFNSQATNLLQFSHIRDLNTYTPNIFECVCKNNNSSVKANKFYFKNQLLYIDDLIVGDRFMYISSGTTNVPAYGAVNSFVISTSTGDAIIELDNRYNSNNTYYNNLNFYLSYIEPGTDVIIRNGAKTIFKLSTTTIGSGNVNRGFIIKQVQDNAYIRIG